jgi:hypothetical protein
VATRVSVQWRNCGLRWSRKSSENNGSLKTHTCSLSLSLCPLLENPLSRNHKAITVGDEEVNTRHWSTDRLQLTWQNLGSFNTRSGCVRSVQSRCFETKLTDLMLETRPEQLLGYLPLCIALHDLRLTKMPPYQILTPPSPSHSSSRLSCTFLATPPKAFRKEASSNTHLSLDSPSHMATSLKMSRPTLMLML